MSAERWGLGVGSGVVVGEAHPGNKTSLEAFLGLERFGCVPKLSCVIQPWSSACGHEIKHLALN